MTHSVTSMRHSCRCISTRLVRKSRKSTAHFQITHSTPSPLPSLLSASDDRFTTVSSNNVARMAEKEDGGKGVRVEKDALVKVKEGSVEDDGKFVNPALESAVCILSPFVAMFKIPLIPLGKMQIIFFLVISLRLASTGSMETEYSSSYKAILNCTFPENSTRTDFAVYFYYEDGKTEPLVDCVWLGDKLECIEQQGFKCRLPVPGTAEIEVPQRFVTRPGKIGYTLNGEDPSNVNFCHFFENHSEGRKESQNKRQPSNIKEIKYDHKASRDFPVWVTGPVIGALLTVVVSVMVIVLYRNVYRRSK